jgi:ATP-dependent RNA helicase RhlE
MTFKELNLLEPILNALTSEGYTNPTPIQEKAIPILLAGRDIMGCAQTGTENSSFCNSDFTAINTNSSDFR